MSLKIIHTKNLRWVDIVNVEEADLNYLKSNFKFHPLDFEDVVTPSVRTKMDEYDDYHFMIMLFPIFHKEQNEIRPAEVDFFVGRDFVVTIHDGSMKTLNNLVYNAHQFDNSRTAHMTRGPGFLLYSILELLFKRSIPILDKINHAVAESGQQIFELDTKTLENLSGLKKNIIIYRRIMKMHKFVLTKLSHSKKDYITFKDSKAFFQNLVEYAENAWDMLASDKESVESFEQTNQSLSTHRINDILKLLTVVSVIIAALTLVTDVFIFFERAHIEQSLGFASDMQIILIFTALLMLFTAGMLYLFKKKKLL